MEKAKKPFYRYDCPQFLREIGCLLLCL